jgi:hypothetical protein
MGVDFKLVRAKVVRPKFDLHIGAIPAEVSIPMDADRLHEREAVFALLDLASAAWVWRAAMKTV